jgi:predicted secreted protein
MCFNLYSQGQLLTMSSYLSVIILLSIVANCSPKPSLGQSYRKGDVVTIEIPSNLGKGYQWMLFDTLGNSVLSHDSRSNPNKTESSDIEIYKIKFHRSGTYILNFYRLRPFDKTFDTTSAQQITKTIVIK